jgi:Tfp pilus assembly protein PilX
MRLIQRLSRSAGLRDERGFTMIIALATLVIVLGLTMAGFAAVNNDFPLAANDSLQKQAYSAAQAGIQRYLYDLDQNSEYWTQCVPTGSTWVNNPSTNPATLNYATVAGTPTEKYAVELLPAAGQTTYTQCNVNNPVASMIQSSGDGAGTIRIRSTGYAGTVKRTLVSNLREQSFLDYEWFTNYETSDPLLQVANAYEASLSPAPGDTAIEPPDLCALNPSSGCGSGYSAALTGAQKQCAQYRFGPPATATTTAGYDRYTNNNAGTGTNGAFYKDSSGTYSCDAINFITADSINGPFHSNDQIQLCGTPTFGRTAADNIEFSGPSPGYFQSCTGTPVIKGTRPSPVDNLQPPPSNASLKTVAAAAYTFTGTTCVTLSATQITYSQPNAAHPSCFSSGLTTTSVAYPPNGVLYVKNGTCSLSYDVENPSYTGNTGCGTVYVKGTDGPPLTIAAENDIVIDGNLLYSNSSTSLLGLIANNFVRVYHPIGSQPLGTNSTPCTGSDSAVLGNLTIDAMLLSLQHSFVVDQYNCGTGLGTLTVTGGIAQNFRGPVGTGSGGSVSTGYAKNYTYDDRLRYVEPPHFIDPVQGSWRVQRQTECDTASAC